MSNAVYIKLTKNDHYLTLFNLLIALSNPLTRFWLHPWDFFLLPCLFPPLFSSFTLFHGLWSITAVVYLSYIVGLMLSDFTACRKKLFGWRCTFCSKKVYYRISWLDGTHLLSEIIFLKYLGRTFCEYLIQKLFHLLNWSDRSPSQLASNPGCKVSCMERN